MGEPSKNMIVSVLSSYRVQCICKRSRHSLRLGLLYFGLEGVRGADGDDDAFEGVLRSWSSGTSSSSVNWCQYFSREFHLEGIARTASRDDAIIRTFVLPRAIYNEESGGNSWILLGVLA